MFRFKNKTTGFTLVETLIVSALMVVVFTGLLAGVRYSLYLIANSKATLSAVSLANDRMEFFRSLPYDEVGTEFGIPPGVIPQNSTTTLNGIEFSERVVVEYVDDPADGLLTATTTDDNGIPSDYKRIKIELTWTIQNETDSLALVSNIVPRSIETTEGGGTVRVNVIDANSNFLAGASVRLINNTTTTTIDTVRLTDASGVALFSGAPASSNYEVIVTAPGYSTDQTYVATTSNPSPITAPFAVLAADISTVTFQIGELSDMKIKTLSSLSDTEITETFSGTTGIATSTDTAVVSGDLELLNTSGSYAASGQAYLQTITPTSLVSWKAVTTAVNLSANTDYGVQFFTGTTSGYTLIPDGDLPGNSSGFTGPVIDISVLDVSTYPSVVIGLSLTTTNSSETPSIDEISLYYRDTETARTSVALDIRGNKTIGTASSTPIYKTSILDVTDGGGELALSDIEFDTYSFSVPAGLDIASACPAMPVQHLAGVDTDVELLLVPNNTHSVRVSVRDSGGFALPGATVDISRTGYSDSGVTNTCGQVYFGSGVTAESDYEITISKTGYTTEVIDPYDIDGDVSTIVILNEL